VFPLKPTVVHPPPFAVNVIEPVAPVATVAVQAVFPPPKVSGLGEHDRLTFEGAFRTVKVVEPEAGLLSLLPP
jgi:hypothetical protein